MFSCGINLDGRELLNIIFAQCSLYSSIVKELFMKNLLRLVKQLLWLLFEVLKRLMARIPNIEIQKVSHCYTITRHLTIHSLFVNFWPEIKSVLNHLSYLLNLTPCDFFLFPKLKLKGFKIERMLFRRHSDHPKLQYGHSTGNTTKWAGSCIWITFRCNKCIEAKGDYFE